MEEVERQLRSYLEKDPIEKKDWESWKKNLDLNIKQTILSLQSLLTNLDYVNSKINEFLAEKTEDNDDFHELVKELADDEKMDKLPKRGKKGAKAR